MIQCVDKVDALNQFAAGCGKLCACGRVMRREGASGRPPHSSPAPLFGAFMLWVCLQSDSDKKAPNGRFFVAVLPLLILRKKL